MASAQQEYKRFLIGICHPDVSGVEVMVFDWMIANKRSLCTRHLSDFKLGDPLEQLLPVDDWQAQFFGCQLCVVADVIDQRTVDRIRELGGEVWFIGPTHLNEVQPRASDPTVIETFEDDVRLWVYQQLDRLFPERIR